MREKKKYGLPYRGYMSSVPRHMVPDDYISEDSYNYDYSPVDGSFSVRAGSATKSSAMLETALTTIQPRRVVPFKSSSMTDGEQSFGVLYGGSYGCFAFYSTGTAANATPDERVVGDDFSATQYPTNFKMIPLLASGAYSRAKTAAERAVLAKGSYNCIEVGDTMLFPSYSGCPHVWNKQFNASTTTGSENVRIMPAGALPPLCPPQIDSWAGTSGPFLADKWFYVSLVYEYEDGAISQPFIPRPPITNIFDNNTSPSRFYGYGLVQVNGVAGKRATSSQERESITMRIYRGGYGCKKVHVLATPLVDNADEAKIIDLQVWFSVDADSIASTNGKQVTMYDFNLTPDPRLVRFDRTWMSPTRFAWVGDQRVWAGGSAGFRGGIIVAPMYNGTDETPLNTGATGEEVELTTTTMVLRYGEGGGAATSYTFTYSSNTIQDLCDSINGLSYSSTSRFVAQLIPGTDPTMPANQLLDNIGDDTGDGSGRIATFSTAYPMVAWVKDSYRDQFSTAVKRRVYYTEGGPGIGGLSVHNWIAGNYRDIADEYGDFVAGGNTAAGQVCVYARGVAVVRNTRDNRTGLDQDYYFTIINERRGCISADSFIQGDGWVGYLTQDGYIVCDGEREVVISRDVYNPGKNYGAWSYEIGKCRNSVAAQLDYSLFRATVDNGRIYVSYRGNNSQLPDCLMVYDFSPSVQATGIAEVLRPDGTTWGWSSPWKYEYATTGVGIGPIGVVNRSDGTYIYSASDTTTTNGRVEQINVASTTDEGATHTITCTTNINVGTENYLTTTDTFARVPAGADISGTGISGGTGVLNVTDATNLTMDTPASSAGTNPLVFTGRTVVAEAYNRLDSSGPRRWSLRRAVPVYLKGEPPSYLTGLQMTISRGTNRSTKRYIDLPESDPSADPFSTFQYTPGPAIQTPAKAYETGFYFDGIDLDLTYDPFWGIEVEYETLDSNR